MRRHLLLLIVPLVALFGASSRAAAAPVNDDILQAVVLHEAGAALNLTLVGATTAAADPACGLPVFQTVWYSYTSPVDQFVYAFVSSTAGSTAVRGRMSAWTGTPGALVAADCHPDANSVQFQARAGETYYFQIASPVPGGVTTLNLNVNPQAFVNPTQPVAPANDLFWYARRVRPPFGALVDIGAGRSDPSDPNPCTATGRFTGDTLWYRFTAAAAQEIDALFPIPPAGAMVGVLTGTLDNLSAVACSGDGDSRLGATRFQALPGVTYYVLFGLDSTLLNSQPAFIAIRPSPPPTDGSIWVPPVATLARGIRCIPDIGCLEVTAMFARIFVSCVAPVPNVRVTMTVRQGALTAESEAFADCSTGSGNAAVVMEVNNSFQAGWAVVNARGHNFDAHYQVDSGPVFVTLRER